MTADNGLARDDGTLAPGFVPLTAAKVVMTTAQRWVPALLPTLTAAFSSTTTTMTSLMGFGQLGGLLTSVTGQSITRHNERRFIKAGIAVVALSSAVALFGVVGAFAVSFFLLVVGHTHVTVASHAWLGHRVPFRLRGRAIGLYETSWSFGLLIGTPLLAAAVYLWSWRAAYLALVLGCGAAFVLVSRAVPDEGQPVATNDLDGSTVDASTADAGTADATAADNADDASPVLELATSIAADPVRRLPLRGLPRSAWPPILCSALSALAGIGFFAIASTWLADTHGLGTRGLGLIAFGYGGVELVASTGVAGLSDRLGTRRAVLFGLFGLLGSIGAVTLANSSMFRSSLPIAVVALLAFLATFEFAFVSSLALVTEAAPDARGAAIGASNAIGTLARAIGVALVGPLYAQWGLNGPLAMTFVATTASIGWALATTIGGHRTVAS